MHPEHVPNGFVYVALVQDKYDSRAVIPTLVSYLSRTKAVQVQVDKTSWYGVWPVFTLTSHRRGTEVYGNQMTSETRGC